MAAVAGIGNALGVHLGGNFVGPQTCAGPHGVEDVVLGPKHPPPVLAQTALCVQQRWQLVALHDLRPIAVLAIHGLCMRKQVVVEPGARDVLQRLHARGDDRAQKPRRP